MITLLAKAVLQYDPNYITENQKQHILMGNGVKYCLSFLPLHLNFLWGHRRCTLYTPGCRMKAYKQPILITVWFFNLHMVWLSLHRGSPVNITIRRTAHCFHFMPANYMQESMFGQPKFPRLSLVSIPVPLALEASALTIELQRYLKYVFLYVFVVRVLLTGKHKAKWCECCFSCTVRYLISNTLKPVK